MSFTTISVIGLGYIGLPTAAAFASRQKQVVGVDINARAVETINRGEIHIVEPDLDRVVKKAVEGGFLRASTTPVEADAYLIAVPTPFKGDHEPDMVYVEAAAKSIAPVLKKGALVILESTSPVGATEQMAQWLADARPDLSFPQQAGEQADINIAYCPERVLPGQVMVELIKKRPRHWRYDARLFRARQRAVQDFPGRRVCGDKLPHRRDVQADGKQLP